MTNWYAREARPYALAAALSALLVLLFWLQVRNPRPGRWAAMAGVAAVGMLSHYFYLVLAGGLTLIALRRLRSDPRFFRGWTLALMAAMLPAGIWIAWFFQLERPTLAIEWIRSPRLGDLAGTFWNLLSGYGGQPSFVSTAFGAVSLLVIAAGLFARVGERDTGPWLLLALALPLFAVWLVSQRRPIYVDRYFIVLLPLIVVSLSRGAAVVGTFLQTRVRETVQRPLVEVALLVALGIGVWSAWQVHVSPSFAKEDWRGLAAHLRAASTREPALWFLHAEMQLPFQRYYGDRYSEISTEMRATCSTPCWWVLRQPYTATHAFAQSVAEADRPWRPDLPVACHLADRWDSPTGIALWQVACLG